MEVVWTHISKEENPIKQKVFILKAQFPIFVKYRKLNIKI